MPMLNELCLIPLLNIMEWCWAEESFGIVMTAAGLKSNAAATL